MKVRFFASHSPICYHIQSRIRCHTDTISRFKVVYRSFSVVQNFRNCDSVTKYSSHEIWSAAESLSRLLPNKSIIPIISPPSVEFIVGILATWLSGGTSVPLNPSMKQQEFEYFMKDLGNPKAILARNIALDSQSNLSIPESLQVIDGIKRFLTPQNTLDSSKVKFPADILSKNNGKDALIIYTSGTTGNPKGVVHTHSSIYSQISCMSRAWKWTKFDRIWCLLPLYHVHGLVNVLLSSLYHGANLEYISRNSNEYVANNSFDPLVFWELYLKRISQNDIFTIFMGVPTMYWKLLNEFKNLPMKKQAEIKDFISSDKCPTRLWISGSSAMPVSLMKNFEQRLFSLDPANFDGHYDELDELFYPDSNCFSRYRILERYGMSETGMILGNPSDGPKVPGLVGKPFEGVDIKLYASKYDINRAKIFAKPHINDIAIVDSENTSSTGSERWDHDSMELTNETNVAGEILVKSPNMFSRYLNRPSETSLAFMKINNENYFRTGDIAVKTKVNLSSGEICEMYRLLGRSSIDIIKTGGIKVSAIEIERQLCEYPDLNEVHVLGIPDKKWGEKLCAIIKPKKSFEKAKFELWCSENLASYKIPKNILLMDQIPRNNMGKVNKKSLREHILQVK